MNLTRNPVLNELVPKEFYLVQNYPNPFIEKTTIKYCVAYKTNVKLTVYDSDGNPVKKLVDEEKNPGTYDMEFYTANLPSGVYFYKLAAGKFIDTKKMVVQK
jgi:hypothetical protein